MKSEVIVKQLAYGVRRVFVLLPCFDCDLFTWIEVSNIGRGLNNELKPGHDCSNRPKSITFIGFGQFLVNNNLVHNMQKINVLCFENLSFWNYSIWWILVSESVTNILSSRDYLLYCLVTIIWISSLKSITTPYHTFALRRTCCTCGLASPQRLTIRRRPVGLIAESSYWQFLIEPKVVQCDYAMNATLLQYTKAWLESKEHNSNNSYHNKQTLDLSSGLCGILWGPR